MNTYEIILMLDGVPEISEEIAGALMSSGCEDGSLRPCEGTTSIVFTRDADSFEEALFSAIDDVNRSDCPATVSHVGKYDIITKPLIVERANVSNRRIFEYIKGEKGPGDFPSPLYEVGVTQYYSWREIGSWLNANTNKEINMAPDPEFVESINAMLQLKKHVKSRDMLESMWDRIK